MQSDTESLEIKKNMPLQKLIEKNVALNGGLEKNLKNSLTILKATSAFVKGLSH
jgi:hypothetical protein